MSDTIESFTVAVDEAQIQDLRDRLARTRWPDGETPDDWSQGIPLQYTQDLCQYWLRSCVNWSGMP